MEKWRTQTPGCLSHSPTTLDQEGILLWGRQKRHCEKWIHEYVVTRSWIINYPGSAREGSRVIVHVVGALEVAHSKHTGFGGVESKRSPISNGLTTVADLADKKKLQSAH